MSNATCRFCGCTDDSIQVICESRCLICSRCQQITVIRRLLVDHTIAIDINPSTNSQATQTYLKGFCPVCEAPMASTMLSLISTFKELYRANNDEKTMGRLLAGMELVEHSTAISSFLKRYRATYEPHTDGRRNKESSALSGAGGGGLQSPTPHVAVASRPNSSQGPSVDFETTANSTGGGGGVGAVNPNAMLDSRYVVSMEGIYDLYTAPTKTSLSAVMKFIADCYAAQWNCMLRNGRDSMVTTMMRLFNRKRFSQRTNDLRTKAILDYIADSTGTDSTELLLFGRLIGLQPRQTASIRPAWAHVSMCVFAAGTCERCLKGGHFIDITGHPTLTDFRSKICKNPKNPKIISLRKALRIVQLLKDDKQPYWMLTPLIPACVEYATKLPWDDSSVNKLLNLVFFVALFGESVEKSGENAGSPQVLQRKGSQPSFAQAAGGFSPNATPLASPNRSRRPSAAPDFSSNICGGNDDGVNLQTKRLNILRSIEFLVKRLWASSANATLSAAEPAKQLSFLSTLHQHKQASFVKMSAARAYELAGSRTISLSELAYVCIYCWDAEYEAVLLALSCGNTSLKRRPAISGYYDPTRATMNGAERLCMTRLLHWYSGGKDFQGVDWEDVEQKNAQRMYPFSIPPSLLEKSHNELHHLADRLAHELRAQKQKDAEEDELAQDGPYSTQARGLPQRGTEKMLSTESAAARSDDYVTSQEIERFNRQQYLASQTLGYVDKIRLEDDVIDEDTQPSLLHRASSLDPRILGNSTPLLRESAKQQLIDRNIAEIAAARDSIPRHPQYGPDAYTLGGLQRPLSPVAGLSSVPGGETLRTHAGVHVPIPLPFQPYNENSYENENIVAESASSQRLERVGSAESNDETTGGFGGTVPPLHRRHSLANVGFAPASAPSGLTLNMADMMDNDTSALTNAGLLRASQRQSGGDGRIDLSGTVSSTNETQNIQPFRMSDGLSEFERRVQAITIHDSHAIRAGMTHAPSGNLSLRGGAGADYTGNLNFPPLQPMDLHQDPQKSKFYGEFNADREYENFEAIYEEVDSKYNSVLSTMRRTKLEAARLKIQQRIAAQGAGESGSDERMEQKSAPGDRNQLNDESNAKIHGDGDGDGGERSGISVASSSSPHHTVGTGSTTLLGSQHPNLRTIAHLDFNNYLTRGGQVLVDLATHLSAESAIRYFSVHDRSVTRATFEYIAQHYFKPWQMQHLARIDINNVKLGQHGAISLSEQFRRRCHLIHLSLNGFGMGGTGLKRLLESIIEGGGAKKMLRLELQGNEITMALESFALINKFTSLRALDLSHNCFTLDTTTQCRTFTAALSTLSDLRSLSVAHNKIQDRGLQLMCDIARRFLPKLQLLDMAGCFLTKSCFQVLHDFLKVNGSEEQRTSNPLLEEIMLQANVFTPQQEAEIATEYGNIARVKINANSKYIGIAFPLRYDIREHGLDQHLIVHLTKSTTSFGSDGMH